jgi:hypothetical protein
MLNNTDHSLKRVISHMVVDYDFFDKILIKIRNHKLAAISK